MYGDALYWESSLTKLESIHTKHWFLQSTLIVIKLAVYYLDQFDTKSIMARIYYFSHSVYPPFFGKIQLFLGEWVCFARFKFSIHADYFIAFFHFLFLSAVVQLLLKV